MKATIQDHRPDAPDMESTSELGPAPRNEPIRMLVAVDFSQETTAVLKEAVKYARLLSAKLWLIHVVPPDPAFVGYEVGPQSVRDNVAKDMRERHRKLDQEAGVVAQEGVDVTPLMIQGSIVESLIGEAAKHRVDFIVMGSHGHGAAYQFIVGSASEGVLQRSPCPVFLVPVKRA